MSTEPVNETINDQLINFAISTKNIVVDSKTLGTSLSYRMRTHAANKSRLVLSMGKSQKIPFIENTLLELTIDTESSWLDRPVQCIAKVLTRDDASDPHHAQFDVKIVQMEPTLMQKWYRSIEDL